MISSRQLNARRVAIRSLPLLVTALVAGCGTRQQNTDSFLGFITPYRIDIVQGNAVTKEQVAAVKLGMTRAQVRDVLGSPMLTDLFHAERWDYIFTIRRPGTDPQRRHVVAVFEGNVLKRLDVPEGLPTENEFVAAIAPPQDKPTPKTLELSEEQRKALPIPPKKDAPPTEAVGPIRTYPPLETR